MISRRLVAVTLILGSGGVGCFLKVGGAGVGGSGGVVSTADTTTATTTTTSQGPGVTSTTDTTAQTGVTATTGDTGASTTTTGSGGCTVPDTVIDCASACHVIFACGDETCGGAQQLCAGYAPMGTLSETAFTGDSTSNACLENCQIQEQSNPGSFIGGINPSDCTGTITSFTSRSACAANACQVGHC